MVASVKLTVGGIITRDNNGRLEILLTRRNVQPFKDKWCIPGGHVELYEDAVSAVIREIKEETNLDFQPVFLHYMDEIFTDRNLHNVVLMFYGEATNELIPSPDEVSEADWFSLDDAMKTELAFHHERAINLYAKKIGYNPQ